MDVVAAVQLQAEVAEVVEVEVVISKSMNFVKQGYSLHAFVTGLVILSAFRMMVNKAKRKVQLKERRVLFKDQ